MDAEWSNAVVVTNEREMEQAKRVATRFFVKAKLTNPKEVKQGEDPKFENREYVQMFIPGDKNNIICKPVDKQVMRYYGERYKAWKAGKEEEANGLPLENLPGIMPSHLEELRFHRVRTVEELAALSDELTQRLGIGYQALSEKARKHLEKLKSGAGDEKLRAAVAQKDAEIAALNKRLEALESKPKGKKGQEAEAS